MAPLADWPGDAACRRRLSIVKSCEIGRNKFGMSHVMHAAREARVLTVLYLAPSAGIS